MNKEISLIITIMVILLIFTPVIIWVNKLPRHFDCLEWKTVENRCSREFIMMSPPIREAEELKEACDNNDFECLSKVVQKVIKSKIKNKADDFINQKSN